MESDGNVLGELPEANPRVQRHRSRSPRERFVGEERRRVQELCVGLDGSLLEVVGVGVIKCGEEELVRQVLTLFRRNARFASSIILQVQLGSVRQVELVLGGGMGSVKLNLWHLSAVRVSHRFDIFDESPGPKPNWSDDPSFGRSTGVLLGGITKHGGNYPAVSFLDSSSANFSLQTLAHLFVGPGPAS